MSDVRQREELLIGTELSAQTNLADFIDSASDTKLGIFSADGSAVADGVPFKVYQKAGDGYEFSDTVDPKKVKKVTLAAYADEVQKKVEVGGFVNGAVLANTTYVLEVYLYNPDGAFSTENFEIVSGYFVTGQDVANVTATDIMNGLKESIDKNLKLRGDKEVEVTVDTDSIHVEGKFQKNVPGKDAGRQVQFEAKGKAFDNTAINNSDLGLFTSTVEANFYPGQGTGKSISNKEWFTKGFKYDVYRGTAYPADFNTPYYANVNGKYNVIIIHYFDERHSPTNEKQFKSLTLAIEDAGIDADENDNTNAILAKLTEAGVENVPADLPAA